MFGRSKDKNKASQDADTPRPQRRMSWLSRAWESMPPSRRRTIVRIYFALIVSMVVGAGSVYGVGAMEKQVTTGRAQQVPTSMKVVLADVPAWMPGLVLDQIAESLTPRDVKPSDPKLAEAVYKLAQTSPWIKKVDHAAKKPTRDPRRVLVEVKAEFRRPLARVVPQSHSTSEFVDFEGYRLPSEQVARYFVTVNQADGKAGRQVFFVHRADVPRPYKAVAIHYMTIEGVANDPPGIGVKWDGSDVCEGLRMVQLMNTRDYANQITTVDVRNFGGAVDRNKPQLSLRAKIGDGPETIIKFGRFPDPNGDWEIPTDRKMRYLDLFAAENKGKLTGAAAYIDLQGDQLRYRPLNG